MRTLADLKHLSGVKALVRVDFNVPVKDIGTKNESVADDFRIRTALSTIEHLSSKGAKVVLMSHLEQDGLTPSLSFVADHLQKLGLRVEFIGDIKKAYDIIENSKEGEPNIFLLENLRHFPGEKANDDAFAKQLASLGDFYVNDAFSACHREHASIVGVPKHILGYAGIQLEQEVKNLMKAFSPAHPFLLMIGGAKFDTKLPLIEKFLDAADTIFIGGALAHDALKAIGREIGISKTSNGNIRISHVVSRSNVMLPVDAVVQKHVQKDISDIHKEDKILDAGKKTCALLKEKIDEAKFIIWNGPLGLYEEGYKEATLEVAKMIGKRGKGVDSIVGGGDTEAAIASLGITDKFTFISTGGGAMLGFLVKGTLPGIEALKRGD